MKIERSTWKRRGWAALTVVVATVAMMGTAAASPPSASAAAWNEGGVYLEWPPDSNFGNACVSRRIWLKRDAYAWKLYIVHPDHPDDAGTYTRWLELRAGWYDWKDCVGYDPRERGYIQCSWLDELATAGGPARHCRWQWGLPGGRRERAERLREHDRVRGRASAPPPPPSSDAQSPSTPPTGSTCSA